MKYKTNINQCRVFAPATCSNLAVGFDLLGFPLQAIGDEVCLTRTPGQALHIESIEAKADLPYDIDENIATWAIKRFCQDFQLPCEFALSLKKGIALGSGMGGSAASVVAALVSLNQFLQEPVELDVLAKYAIAGEGMVSGSPHADNAVPCLFGGLTLTRSLQPLDILNLPYPELFCVLVHPNLQVNTKDARALLPKTIKLTTVVQQNANLASFIMGLYEQDYQLIKRSLQDVMIEPHRKHCITGFESVKAAALKADALGASISGSGPSVFAFAASQQAAEKIKTAMIAAFAQHDITTTAWISPISSKGATVCEIS